MPSSGRCVGHRIRHVPVQPRRPDAGSESRSPRALHQDRRRDYGAVHTLPAHKAPPLPKLTAKAGGTRDNFVAAFFRGSTRVRQSLRPCAFKSFEISWRNFGLDGAAAPASDRKLHSKLIQSGDAGAENPFGTSHGLLWRTGLPGSIPLRPLDKRGRPRSAGSDRRPADGAATQLGRRVGVYWLPFGRAQFFEMLGAFSVGD
jgi:hypothetical protein